MKSVFVIGLLMLGLGIGIGWLAKPVPQTAAVPVPTAVKLPKPPESAVIETSSVPPGPGKRAQREPLAKKFDGQPTDEQMNQVKKMQTDMSKAMAKRQRDKFEKYITRLSENLNLTDAQKAGLAQWLDECMKKLDDLDFSNPESMAGITEAFQGFTNKGLEDQLAGSLSEDQQEALAAFKDREHRSRVDIAALKSLTRLQGVIEFEEGQRDEVYKVLSEAAESSLAEEDAAPDLNKIMTDGMGIDMDPYDLRIQQAMSDSMKDSTPLSTTSGRQKEMVARIREVIDRRIETKIEQLRLVLNEEQLDLYRNELKTKGMGIYGNVLSSMESASGD